jgi:MFS family permease
MVHPLRYVGFIRDRLARIHYGWVVVGILFLLLAAIQGITMAGIPVLDARVIADLDITRGALKFRDLIQIFSAAVSCMAIGYIADKTGPKVIIYTGLAVMTVTLNLYSRVTTVDGIYGMHVLLGYSYASAHVVIVALILSQWFDRKRGIAISLALSGTSLGAAFFPQLGTALAESFGWRGALRGFSLIPLALLPIVIVFLKIHPSDKGLAPVGSSTENAMGHAPRLQPVARAQFRTREFGALLLAAVIVYYAASTMIAHTFLSLKDRAFSARAAAAGLSLIFVTSLIGKILAGFEAERFGTRPIWLLHQCLMWVGCLFLTSAAVVGPGGLIWLWPGLITFGLGWGGCYSMTQVIVAERFAGLSLGKLVGFFALMEGLSAGSGSWLTGVMFDWSGSYGLPFGVCCGLLTAAILATVLTTHPFFNRPGGGLEASKMISAKIP